MPDGSLELPMAMARQIVKKAKGQSLGHEFRANRARCDQEIVSLCRNYQEVVLPCKVKVVNRVQRGTVVFSQLADWSVTLN